MTKITLNKTYRLGEGYRGKGIGAVIPNGNSGTLTVRLADIHYLGRMGWNLSASQTDTYLADIVAARNNNKEAKERLKALNYIASKFLTDNRKQIEGMESELLSPLASKSIGAGIRIHSEEADHYRTPYYRDLGRIIHSVAFRNLAGKTQVFAYPKSPSIHTRLFHSLKVAQLAESIGSALGLNIDLIWAIGLGHDLGHAPFGHPGEAALNEISLRELKRPFKHNIQSLRVCRELEKYFSEPDKKGLNLTLEVLDGILHHYGEGDEYVLFPRQEQSYCDLKNTTIETQPDLFTREEERREKIKKILDHEKAKDPPLTYEACVIRLADRIAYLPVDLEDALTHGFVKEEDLLRKEREQLNGIRAVLGKTPRKMFDVLITNVIEESRRTGKIAMSERVGEALNDLQKFNYAIIYMNRTKLLFEENIPRMFETLFDYYIDVEGLSSQQAIDKIASMTDLQVDKEIDSVVKPPRRPLV